MRFRSRTDNSDDDPTCNWAPGKGREGPRSVRDRIDDLQELADQSRSSKLPPPPPDFGEVSMSIRAAIRGIDLFPARAAAPPPPPTPASSDAPREREPTSSRPRPITFDRMLLAVAVGGSLVMGYKVGEERAARSGRSSLSAPELAGKVLPDATERAHRIATNFQLAMTPPRAEEPVKTLPDAKPTPMPAPSWQSHAPRANRNAAPVAKAPAPAPAAEAEEEPTPSVPPPTRSLVEAMAEAVKAKP
ncbi:hypothetical protein KEG38_06500 [Polyangium jinanense]|uniref:hypothetical protein n=1 Tax=Polyangium jinanense TaxID=2829994 RepID=UPI002341366E|nr:hypothetical protein [Polyangium jinanense]MDC3953486.1 hypothetical protein [Polyangium jinanense]